MYFRNFVLVAAGQIMRFINVSKDLAKVVDCCDDDGDVRSQSYKHGQHKTCCVIRSLELYFHQVKCLSEILFDVIS